MSELPTGWANAQLGDLVTHIVGGGTPSKANSSYFQGTIPFMTVKDMHSRFIGDTQDHITQEALGDSASTMIPADTLIVASRMSLGKIARPEQATAINQDLKALFLHQGIDKTYVEYAWRANESRIQAMGTGTTVKGIRLEDIRSLQVPLAPSAEQTRIADQLDTLLARINACQHRLDAIPALLKRFQQAVLDAATTGALTQDWRLNQPKPSDWVTMPVRDLISDMRNGIATKPDENPNGLRILRISAVRPGLLDTSDHRFLSMGFEQASAYSLQEGDLLYTRYNGTLEFVGVCALLRNNLPGFVYPDKLIRVRTRRDRILPAFLELASNCSLSRAQIESHVKSSAGQKGISGADLKSIQVRVPPIPEQAEIVRRVEALLKLANQIEARYTKAFWQAQRLPSLVLAKAFRGELLPQDPSDEPASELLARIATQRKSVTPANKTRQPRAPSAARAPKESASMAKSR